MHGSLAPWALGHGLSGPLALQPIPAASWETWRDQPLDERPQQSEVPLASEGSPAGPLALRYPMMEVSRVALPELRQGPGGAVVDHVLVLTAARVPGAGLVPLGFGSAADALRADGRDGVVEGPKRQR